MASGHDLRKKRKPTSASHADAASPLPDTSETPASRKRKKKSQRIEEDVDELGQDESWDSDTIGHHRETYTPRLSRRRSNATNIHEDETAQQEEVEEPVDVVEIGVEEESENHITDIVADPMEENSASNIPPTTALEVPAATEGKNLPTAQPKKKRGRKKKQPVVEEAVQDEQTIEEPVAPVELDPPFQAVEVDDVSDKPKRKRGRPRKSDQAKATEIDAPPMPAESPDDPIGKKTLDEDYNEASAKEDEGNPKSKKAAKKQKKKDQVNVNTLREDGNLALKEVDVNSITPSRSASSEPVGKKSKEEPAAADNSKAKPKTKETPKSAASQSKALYRVGLSKKSRIAPLLKCIKK